jgi:hypothetical protein
VPTLCARATADPALLEGRLAGRTRAGGHAFAVADHVGRGTDAGGWFLWRRGRETVRAGEAAWVSIGTRRLAMIRVFAVRRRMAQDLK